MLLRMSQLFRWFKREKKKKGSVTFNIPAPPPKSPLKVVEQRRARKRKRTPKQYTISLGRNFGTFSRVRPFARTRQIAPGRIVRIG